MVLEERQTTNNGQRNALQVNSADDIEEIRSLILSKPVITTVKYDSVKCLVIVNTSKLEINQAVQEACIMAEKCLAENKNFFITINLDKTISTWYHFRMMNFCNNESTCHGANFYIAHNATKRCYFAREYIECDRTQGLCCWWWCLPTCLLIGCPYIIYRHCVKGITDVKIAPDMRVFLGSAGDFEDLLRCYRVPSWRCLTNYRESSSTTQPSR